MSNSNSGMAGDKCCHTHRDWEGIVSWVAMGWGARQSGNGDMTMCDCI